MKTVKDVVAAYPDGWPVDGSGLDRMVNGQSGYYIITTAHVFKYVGNPELEIICTREEYEQEWLK